MDVGQPEKAKGESRPVSRKTDAMTTGRSASGIPEASKRKEAARQRFWTGAELGRTVKPQGETVKHEEKRSTYGYKAE